MKVRFTVAAEEDLVSIFLEGANQFGEAQATKYHTALGKAFDLIALNPEMARVRMELKPPIRIHPHGTHLIVYLVDSVGVLIVRVRHGREDWQSDFD